MGFDYSRRNKRWQAVRLRVLKRDRYLCREAARYGRVVDATVVHHIWPAEDYPEYAYAAWNLVSLSAAAHDAMHDRATHALTPLGERWRRNNPPPAGPPAAPPKTPAAELSAHAENFSRVGNLPPEGRCGG